MTRRKNRGRNNRIRFGSLREEDVERFCAELDRMPIARQVRTMEEATESFVRAFVVLNSSAERLAVAYEAGLLTEEQSKDFLTYTDTVCALIRAFSRRP